MVFLPCKGSPETIVSGNLTKDDIRVQCEMKRYLNYGTMWRGEGRGGGALSHFFRGIPLRVVVESSDGSSIAPVTSQRGNADLWSIPPRADVTFLSSPDTPWANFQAFRIGPVACFGIFATESAVRKCASTYFVNQRYQGLLVREDLPSSRLLLFSPLFSGLPVAFIVTGQLTQVVQRKDDCCLDQSNVTHQNTRTLRGR